jgi:hypothetical protein
MHNKKIRGFNLDRYIRDDLKEDRLKFFIDIIREDINSGG